MKTILICFIIFATSLQAISQCDKKTLEGTVKEKTCDWKEPFRNGKTVYHANVTVEGGTTNAIFTVEGKDGKITLTLTIETMADKKFLIYIDRYEEAK